MSSNMLAKLQELRQQLNRRNPERTEVIDAILVALIAGQHVALIGPPGTAKSQLATDVAGAFEGCRMFQWLLTRETASEHLFGGPDVKVLLEEGRMTRIAGNTNVVQASQMAFLDEVFNANTYTLNGLLSLLLERTFENEPSPLRTVIAASNQLPSDSRGGGGQNAAALWDRIGFRILVQPVQTESAWSQVVFENKLPPVQVKLDWGEFVEWADAAVNEVQIPESLQTTILKISADLETDAHVSLSLRRWRMAVQSGVRGHAALHGRQVATTRDLAALRWTSWTKLEEVQKVCEALDGTTRPDYVVAARIRSELAPKIDAYLGAFKKMKPADAMASGSEVLEELNKGLAELEALTHSPGETPNEATVEIQGWLNGQLSKVRRAIMDAVAVRPQANFGAPPAPPKPVGFNPSR